MFKKTKQKAEKESKEVEMRGEREGNRWQTREGRRVANERGAEGGKQVANERDGGKEMGGKLELVFLF